MLDAQQGGFGFRLDESGGYFVELSAGSTEAVLAKWLMPADRIGHGYKEIQRGRLTKPLRRGEPLAFKLLVVDTYLELELDGQVVLATLSRERAGGRFGLWAESGGLEARGLRWAPMSPPRHG